MGQSKGFPSFSYVIASDRRERSNPLHSYAGDGFGRALAMTPIIRNSSMNMKKTRGNPVSFEARSDFIRR